MSQEGQEPQGQVPAPFEPFTGKLTKTQAGILRTLWDLETGRGQLSNLRHGLHSSAAKLVERGLIWKKDRWPARPVYGITPAGIPAALEAWREVDPERAQAEIEARIQQQLPPAVRPIVEEALATGDLAKANEHLRRLSGGKTVGQVAEEWAAQMQPPADPKQREQRQPDHEPPQQGLARWDAYAHAANQYLQERGLLPQPVQREQQQPQPDHEPPQPPPPQPELVTVTLRRKEFQLVLETLTERCQEIAQGDFDEYGQAQAIGAVAETLAAQSQQSPDHQYRRLLEATAALRYPERTEDLQARIEKTVQRKVQTFIEEQRLEGQRQRQQQQQAQVPPARNQQQGRGYSQEIER